MNRIYQGKVTAVEIPGSEDEQADFLWRRHELFQGAVNFPK
jgi:hypothetical protein